VAKGLFNDDAYNLGISGGFSSPLTAELITQADLIVAFGTALNMWTMRGGKLIGADTKVVQVDIDDHAIGAHRPVQLGVAAEAAATAADAMALLSPHQPARYRTTDIAQRIATGARWDQTATEDLSVVGQLVDPRELTKRLNALLPAQRVVSIDSGNFMGTRPSIWVWQMSTASASPKPFRPSAWGPFPAFVPPLPNPAG